MMFYTNLVTYGRLLQVQGPTLILGAVAGPVSVGIFKIGVAAATGVGQLTTPAWNAVMPRLARLWSNAEFAATRQLIRQSTVLAAAVLVPAAAVTILLRHPLLTLFGGHQAARAGTVFALLAAAQVVGGILFWNIQLLYAARRVRVVTLINLPCIALTLGLVLGFAYAWGADGTAAAMLLSALLLNTLQTVAALRALREEERQIAINARVKHNISMNMTARSSAPSSA